MLCGVHTTLYNRLGMTIKIPFNYNVLTVCSNSVLSLLGCAIPITILLLGYHCYNHDNLKLVK